MPSFSNTGFSSPSAASRALVTSIVLAPYWLDMVISTPQRPMITVSPNFGSAPSTTRATSLSRTLKPLVWATTTSPRISGVSAWPSVWSVMRWLRVSMKPAPITPVETRAAASTSDSARS